MSLDMQKVMEERYIQRGVGVTLIAVISIYTLYVTFAGGIINPDHPKNEAQLLAGLTEYVIDQQTFDDIWETALAKPVGSFESFTDESSNRYYRMQLNDTISLHKEYVRDPGSVPSAYVADLRRFMTEEAPNFSEKERFGLDYVEAKTVAYITGDTYQLLCATNEDYLVTLRGYAKNLVDKKWLINSARVPDSGKWGYFDANDGDANVEVVVAEKDVFPGYSTVVLIDYGRTRGNYFW